MVARMAKRKSWLRKDRKSTRLNSSHLVISYAVFCLKKKKKIKRLRQHISDGERRRHCRPQRHTHRRTSVCRSISLRAYIVLLIVFVFFFFFFKDRGPPKLPPFPPPGPFPD